MSETVSFPNKRNISLSGVLNNGKLYSPVIILVHGFAGNKDENGLFVEVEDYFSKMNYNVFRFDFEGAGESDGDFLYSNLEKQVSDFKSAIDYVSNKYTHKDFGVIGFSLGATVSLLASDSRIKAYSFWSPALFPSKDMFPRYNTPEINYELKENGFISKAGLKVGKDIISDLENYSLENNMKNLDKPVLLVHGTDDPRINYQSTVLGKYYFKNAELELINGASHSFKNNPLYRKKLFKQTLDFFNKMF